MPDYTNSKIYKITSDHPELEGLCYVGSTTKKYLSNRMTNHRQDAKNGKGTEKTIWGIMRQYGIETFKIILLEKVVCNDKDELRQREQQWINELKPSWNCYGAFLSEEKYKEYQQAYRQSEEYKAKMREYHKQYYQKKKLALNKA